MKAVAIFVAVFCLLGVSAVRGDSTIASVQQTLKEQGFYYGENTGIKDTDTTAAIRRYQIRNGLQITGDLNTETRKSLGLKGAAPAAPATPAPKAAPVRPAPAPRSEPSDSREYSPGQMQPPSPQGEQEGDSPQPAPGYAPAYRPQDPRLLFQGTPYGVAPIEMQQRVIIGAQTLLTRRGYYRSGIDGVYGPGMEFAVRAFQSRFGIEPNGRLDTATLAALGLLPGQPAPGVTASTRRVFQRPRFVAPRGERIYIPR